MTTIAVSITGVWLRSKGRGDIEVLIERDGKWYSVIKETSGGSISHIVEPSGMLNAPEDKGI